MEKFNLQFSNGIFTIWNLKTNKEECQFQDKEMLAVYIENDFTLDKKTVDSIIDKAESRGTAEI